MNELTEEEKEARYGNRCYICDTPWTKTPRLVCQSFWWHCKKCNMKAENLKEEKEKQNHLSKKDRPVNDIDNSEWYNSNKGWYYDTF